MENQNNLIEDKENTNKCDNCIWWFICDGTDIECEFNICQNVVKNLRRNNDFPIKSKENGKNN